MNAALQKIFVISIAVIVVFFLLFDGGAITEAAIRGDLTTSGARTGQSWIWIMPTLLIFGLGFLVAWLVLGEDEAPQKERHVMSEETVDASSRGHT